MKTTDKKKPLVKVNHLKKATQVKQPTLEEQALADGYKTYIATLFRELAHGEMTNNRAAGMRFMTALTAAEVALTKATAYLRERDNERV